MTPKTTRLRPTLLVASALLVTVHCTGGTVSSPAGVRTGERARPWARPPRSPLPELAVVHRTPEGPASTATAVVAMFNQPMVALGDRRETSTLLIDPPLEGTVRWISPDTVKLDLVSRPWHGTRYTVRIPAGTRSLGGKVLAQDVTWQFHTPPPTLLGAELSPERERYHPNLVEPWDFLWLQFDQPVSPDEIERFVRVRANGTAVPIWASTATGSRVDEEHRAAWVELRARGSFPRAAQVTLTLAPGFRGLEGPLPAVKGATVTFGERPPLSAEGWCDGAKLTADSARTSICWPRSTPVREGLALRFTTPVLVNDVRQHLTIQPATAEGGQPIRPTDWEAKPDCTTEKPDQQCTTLVRLKRGLRWRIRYTVTLRPGLKDLYGQTLSTAVTTAFTTRGLPPELSMTGGPPVTDQEDEWVLERSRPIRIQAVNARTLDLHTAVLGPETIVPFLECLRASRTASRRPSGGAPPRGRCLDPRGPGIRAEERTLAVAGPMDRPVERPLELLPPGRGGVVAFAVSSPEVLDPQQARVRLARVINHTGLNVHARLLPGSLHVWVTSLANGKPVPGASVEVRHQDGRKLHAGRTDVSGLVALPGYASIAPGGGRIPRLYLWVSTATDAAYAIPLRQREPRWSTTHRNPYGSARPWEGEGPHLVGIVGTERSLYRPGDSVHIYGVVRQWKRGAHSPLSGGRATLELTQGGYQPAVIHREEVTLDDFGAFTTRFPIPATAQLGDYGVVLRRGERPILDRSSFGVLQYRAPRFTSKLQPANPSLTAGETLEATLLGRHLSGSPMGGAFYSYSLQRANGFHWTRDGHEFSNCQYRSPGNLDSDGFESRGSGSLDASGTTTLRVALTGKKMECAATHWLNTEVWDATQSAVHRSKTVTIYPGERLVGVRSLPRGARWKRMRVHALVTDRSGKPVAGQRVTLRVYAPRVDTRPPEDRDPLESGYDWSRPALTRQQVASASGTELSFDYPWAHQRVVATVSVTDAQGRTSRSDLEFFRPTAPRPPDRQVPTGPPPLDIQFDQQGYDPGATAKVTVTSRVPLASAMIFFGRERCFLAQPLRFVAGKATVDFKIEESHVRRSQAGGVRVSVVAYPAGPSRDRAALPVLPLTALERLDVRDSGLDLGVELRPARQRYRPGQEVAVDYVVTSRDGRPREVELVVMAVDEAVLRLSDQALRSPYRQLYHEPGHDLLVDELRWYLMRTDYQARHAHGFGGWGGFGKGGGGGGGNLRGWKPPRRRFVTSPLFQRVRSNASGAGRFTFKLPDNLTAYRLVAVAFDRERRAGLGKSRIAVELPAYAVPAVPRQVRVGDRFEGGVVVINAGQPEGMAEVEIQATGLVLTGARVKRVSVPRSGERAVRFALEARTPGPARLTFRIRLGNETDVLEHPVEVVVPTLVQYRTLVGSTEGTAHQTLDLSSAVQPGLGGLDVTFSTSLLGGLKESLGELLRYPYGCMEQRTSQLLPILARISLGSRLGLELPGEAKAVARRALTELQGFQTQGGGFTLWPGGDAPSLWLTAYALHVFHRAQQAGVPASTLAVERTVRYLGQALLPAEDSGKPDPLLGASLPLAALALAEHGYDVERLIRTAFAQHDLLPGFARAQLLHAIGIHRQARASGRRLLPLRAKTRNPGPRLTTALPLDEMATALIRALTRHVNVEGDHASVSEPVWVHGAALMSTSDRTTAVVLSALLAAQPDHPLIDRLARYLVLGRKDAAGHPSAPVRNTQEAAFGLLGLWDFARIRENRVPDLTATVSLGRSTLLSRRLVGRNLSTLSHHVPMADLLRAVGQSRARLGFQRKGTGRLYYSARLTYARQDPREPATSRGFVVDRQVRLLDTTYRPFEAGRLLRLGNVVQVLVTVKNTEGRRYVVVDDPVPAGLEAIDRHLVNKRPGEPGAGETRFSTSAGKVVGSRYDHRELRDDRVLHFVDALEPGTHHFGYLARVTTPGTFVWPAARAVEMYSPEVYGGSVGGTMTTR